MTRKCLFAGLFGLILLPIAAIADTSQEFRYLETQDDPPAASRAGDDPLARSMGARVVRGGNVSIQVNVDGAGLNIVGDAANEPSIAVSPVNPDSIAIGWRQFDSIASNFRQAGWSYTQNGGQNWTFPGVLSPGVFRSDPVLDSDSNGRLYYQSLRQTFDMDVFRSDTGGASWLTPVPSWGGDKNWMVVDKTGGASDGHIYGIWQRFASCCNIGRRNFTRSIDGGDQYQAPVTTSSRSPFFGTMAVGPGGVVYAAGGDGSAFQNTSQIVLARSTTAANSSIRPRFRSTVVDLGGGLVLNGAPNPGGLLGQVYVAADLSDGPGSGNVYMLATVDPAGPDPADVHFVASSNRGVTFTAPMRINTDAPGNWQWFAAMQVDPSSGRIDVIWNDTSASGNNRISELWYAWSADQGATWTSQPVSPSFDSYLGWPNQNKIGDYYDLVSDAQGAHVAYSATFNGEQDVYYLRLLAN